MNDEQTLEQALRKANDLLVSSLHDEEQQRRRRRNAAIASSIIAIVMIAGAVVIAQRWSKLFSGTEAANFDRPKWEKRLTTTLPTAPGADWRAAFATGEELAGRPPEQSWPLLRDRWKQIDSVTARQQYLKAFAFRHNYPRILDVLDLGMTDPSPQVREWAAIYLKEYAFTDFSGDS